MIKVWTDGAEAGLLDRYRHRGSTFIYLPDTAPERAVSITMPVRRLPSYDIDFGLHPIFEMNLPEGVLRERLRLAFAKATGRFDEFDLLSIVGRSQLGRIRYTGEKEQLQEDVPFQSVDEILARRRKGDLLPHLIDKFAKFSGISGVQPKILVRDEKASVVLEPKSRLSESYRGATHIVKLWDPNEYPQLATNEYFCLVAAKKCGLEVPRYRLAEDGMALVIDRFDLRSDGTYRGLEDFCVLNARRTDEKYRGSYETSVMKRFQDFANSPYVNEDLEKLFALIALNCALRNGDAHLKNFAITYDNVLADARLAPVYDLVTTTVYLPKDNMALTLNGTTKWPSAKDLRKLGETRIAATPSKVKAILERVQDAMSDTIGEIRSHAKQHPDFGEIATRMIQQWEQGIASALRLT